MKKQSSFMTNQTGFVLPYVLFLVVLILVLVTTNVTIYYKEIEMQEYHLEQLKIETLIQMSHIAFRRDHSLEDIEKMKTEYSFLDGVVELIYQKSTAENYALQFIITTTKGNSYTATSTMAYH